MKYSKLTTQRGDSLTLNMELPSNFSYDNDRYNQSLELDDTGVLRWETKKLKDTYRNESFGISKLNIINDEKLEISISGKILGDNYKEGITLDTISDVVDILNEVGGMNITTDGILTNSIMRTFDNTFNIDLDEKDCVDDYIKSLQFGCIGNAKLGLTGYTDESLVLQLDTKVKNRMIFYNKELELRTHSKEFIKKHKIVDDFQNTLRVELNVTSQDKMRQNFGLSNGKVRLIDILQSKENAVRKNFARFVDIKTSEKLLFDYDTLMSMEIKNKPQLHERFFLIEHFKKFKGDIKKVEAMYKSLYSDGKVPNKEKIKIRTYFKEWQTMNTPTIDKQNYTRKFREINEKIKAL